VNNEPLLSVQDLKVHFPLKRKFLIGKRSVVHAVDGVSLTIKRGTTFGIVGESGSGKTTTALAVMWLVPITAGTIDLNGIQIHELENDDLRKVRQHMQIIFQDPYSSLNPRVRAGAIIREPMDLMNVGAVSERDDEVRRLMSAVGLRAEQRALFPHQFSGGQRQRIGVARALASRPNLVVCDEPVSALDVAVQAQVLNLLRRLQDELGLTYLFISHDLGVIQYMCDEIAVMYLGQVVEHADRISLFTEPLHPYTWALLSAVPSADPATRDRADRVRLKGDPPSAIDPPTGCRFASRCPFSQAICSQDTPPLRHIKGGHAVACHLVSDDGVPPQRLN